MRRRSGAVLVVALGCAVAPALAACSSSLTEIVVVVDSDLSVPSELDEVKIDVVGSTSELRSARAPLSSVANLPVTLGLRPEGAASHEVTVTATAYHGGSAGISTVVRTSFIEGRRLVLHMYLLRACATVHCAAPQTCRQGECVDPYVPPESLPQFGGSLDGGASGDAADGGGGHDGGLPTTCMRDADCDDHDLCTGAESCVANACVRGPALACDDGVACTVDTCDATSGCASHGDDSRCTLAAGGHCDTTNGCQYAVCDATTCFDDAATCETALCMGTTCMRQSRCGAGQTCCASTCVAPGCEDGNPCTDDSCGATGCIHADNHAPCSDGNPCSTAETCSAGACQPGTPVVCPPTGSPCTTATCDPTAGGCTTGPASGLCDDGDPCTTVDACAGGTCMPGGPRSCDDGVACTNDLCDPTAGCMHVPDDGNCTAVGGGHCDATMGCQYPACSPLSCTPDPSMCLDATCMGTTCVRTTMCTGSQSCCGGSCVAAGCDDGNPCTTDSCGGSGCMHPPNDSAPCSDGDACTTGDHCSGGACVGTGAISCDDGNPCTDDDCSGGACSHPYNTASCNDGNACTMSDHCSSGACVGGGATNCDDGSDCTSDTCVSTTGCRHMSTCGCCLGGSCEPMCSCVPPYC